METIIVVGHGSPKKEANNVNIIGRLLHDAIHPGCNGACVKVAYLQFAEPDIMGTIKACVAEGATRIIVHPFFLSSGMHVTKDIPETIEQARSQYPTVEFVYTEPLGTHDKLVQIMIDRISEVRFATPDDIETRSFEIIGEELEAGEVPDEQAPIVKRVIHSTADFELAKTLVFSPDAVKTGLEAIRGGKNILTDIEMVKTGINKRLLARWGGKVICGIDDEEVVEISRQTGQTRASVALEKALSDAVGIIVIGNAPTALLKAIEILAGAPAEGTSPLVIGVPVGFVKALESKVLLSAQKFPFITNLSRKGGTPVAVAIVNALLKMAGE